MKYNLFEWATFGLIFGAFVSIIAAILIALGFPLAIALYGWVGTSLIGQIITHIDPTFNLPLMQTMPDKFIWLIGAVSTGISVVLWVFYGLMRFKFTGQLTGRFGSVFDLALTATLWGTVANVLLSFVIGAIPGVSALLFQAIAGFVLYSAVLYVIKELYATVKWEFPR